METQNTPEKLIADEEVAEALKNGFDNPQTQVVYNKWLDQLEYARTEDSLYDIKVSVRRAEVYFKAGFIEQAVEDLVETLEGALAELVDSDPLVIEINRLLVEMRGE